MGTETSYVARLGIVYADPIRLTIVTELNMREMSPPQFFREFGGGSVDMVRWHFKKLTEHGWLRKTKTAASDGTPGRPQNFYRATERAVIDTETWEALPVSVRGAFSARTLEQLGIQIGEALQVGTLDSRADRHLSWTPIVLDEQGWRERSQALADCFHAFEREQDRAKLRLQANGEIPLLMTVALAGFESPRIPDSESPAAPPESETGVAGSLHSPLPLTMRLAKVFADPLNLKILTELNLAPSSATQLKQTIGGSSVYAFDRRCKMLCELGWAVKVDSKTGGRRRGAKEIFYRATGPAYFETSVWKELSHGARCGMSGKTLQQFEEKVVEAIHAGTFDKRHDRHLSWMPLSVDERGWNRVIALLDRFFDELFPTQKAAKERLADTGEAGIVATYFLAGFESPPSSSMGAARR